MPRQAQHERDSIATPLSDAALNARLAEYGVALRPDPGGKAWPGGWWPGDPPAVIETGEDADPFAHSRVFDLARRVRFLDALATCGEVRAAAARVGVSRETAYRARRRDRDFARLWDAALVHARARSEAELATRALDGVAVPVFVRGEHVATWRKHDARLLLAHLGRLDRRVEQDYAAGARAERFDELLAAMAGHAPPEELAEDLAEAARVRDPYGAAAQADLPPTREECLVHARDRAITPFAEPDDRWDDAGEEQCDDEPLDPAEEEELRAEEERHAARCAAAAEAETRAATAYDGWLADGLTHLDAILAEETGEASGAPSACDAACDTARDTVPLRGGSAPQAAGAVPEDRPARSAPPARCGKRARKRKAARARAARRAAASPPPAEPPREYKSFELGFVPARRAGPPDRVASVNTGARRVSGRGRRSAGTVRRLGRDRVGRVGIGGGRDGARPSLSPSPEVRASSPVLSDWHGDRFHRGGRHAAGAPPIAGPLPWSGGS